MTLSPATPRTQRGFSFGSSHRQTAPAHRGHLKVNLRIPSPALGAPRPLKEPLDCQVRTMGSGDCRRVHLGGMMALRAVQPDSAALADEIADSAHAENQVFVHRPRIAVGRSRRLRSPHVRPLPAAERAHKLPEADDMIGEATWRGILKAVEELGRGRREGEPVN